MKNVESLRVVVSLKGGIQGKRNAVTKGKSQVRRE